MNPVQRRIFPKGIPRISVVNTEAPVANKTIAARSVIRAIISSVFLVMIKF